MSRTGGRPFGIGDYSVQMIDPVTQAKVRVKGLESMSVSAESETVDGRAGEGLWAEMFVKSRSVSGELSGRPIADRATGVRDPGQALMHAAAFGNGGFDNDRTLVIADAVGRAVAYDCVVTGERVEADEDGETISWDWEGVGKPRALDYVQATGIHFEKDGAAIGSAAIPVNGKTDVDLMFTPENASNRRFAYCVTDESVAEVADVEDGRITLRGVGAGQTTLQVRAMNNALTAAIAVAVTA